MCEVCTEAVHSVELWTRVTLQLWGCVKYVRKQSIPWRFEHGLQYNFGTMCEVCKCSPFRSTLNTGYITTWDMCEVCTEAVHYVALLNTGYITSLDMCEVCTEAVHSVALWTRGCITTLDMWSMYRSSPFRRTLNTGYITTLDMCEVCTGSSPFRSTLKTGYSTTLDMCEVCTEAVHCVALWTRVTLQL